MEKFTSIWAMLGSLPLDTFPKCVCVCVLYAMHFNVHREQTQLTRKLCESRIWNSVSLSCWNYILHSILTFVPSVRSIRVRSLLLLFCALFICSFHRLRFAPCIFFCSVSLDSTKTAGCSIFQSPLSLAQPPLTTHQMYMYIYIICGALVRCCCIFLVRSMRWQHWRDVGPPLSLLFYFSDGA